MQKKADKVRYTECILMLYSASLIGPPWEPTPILTLSKKFIWRAEEAPLGMHIHLLLEDSLLETSNEESRFLVCMRAVWEDTHGVWMFYIII